MKPQPRYKPGDKIGGRYLVHKALLGGMGEVYLCLDLEENYPYALKTFQQRYLIDGQGLRRAFEREVATWVALEKHPNIVRCFWMQIFDSQPFMALEWIAGEEGKGADLRSWLRRGPLELNLALEIAIDICNGLLHAQAKQPGLVHRDLKPENILMAQGGLAKITDFGLAQIVQTAGLEVDQESTVDSRHSLVGQRGIAGTPAYMAPEQWRGEPLDERTDIYALSCILYELLTGVSPFTVDFMPSTPQQMERWLSAMQAAHTTGSYPKPQAMLPPRLDELMQRCLAKSPSVRPASLPDLASQLTELYQQNFGQSPPPRSAPGAFTAVDYNNRGGTYHALHLYKAALTDFDRAVELDPNSSIAFFGRGNTYSSLQQHQAALTNYSRAIELNPKYAKAYTNRGGTYADLHQYDAALADFSHAIVLDPNDAIAYINRGGTYADLHQYDAALADCRRAIDLEPDSAKVYTNRGTIYVDLRQYDAALADFSYAINLDPHAALSYYNRGTSYAALRQYDDALIDFSRAIDLDPAFAQAYVNRGLAYQALEQYEQALTDFSCAITLNINSAQVHINRGGIYANLQQYEAALVDFGRAIELEPNSARAYINRGVIHSALQRFEAALSDYGHAIDLDPTSAQAYTNRGGIYASQQRYEAAQADFAHALELDPNSAQAHLNMGVFRFNQGKLAEALPYFEQAARLGDAKGAQYAAQAQQMLGREPTPHVNPAQQAFAAFAEADSLAAMRHAVVRFPLLHQAEFMAMIEQAIAQQVPQAQRPAFQQRLAWLKEVAKEQSQ